MSIDTTATIDPQVDTTIDVPWQVRLTYVSPALAQRWLGETNTRNRKLDVGHVGRLADEMTNGRWDFTPQPIVFGDDGVLIDGQHRLAAVVKSGQVTPFMLVIGVDPVVFRSFGLIKLRSVSDILGIHGATYRSGVAAGYKLLENYRENHYTGRSAQQSATRALELMESEPGLMEWAPLAQGGMRKIGLAPAVSCVALYVTHLANPGLDQSSWIEGLTTGVGLPAGDPRLALRERLRADKAAHKPHSSRDQLALYIKAWNAWVTGRSVQILRLGAGESVPEPVRVGQQLRAA